MEIAPRTQGERPSSRNYFIFEVIAAAFIFTILLAFLRWPIFEIFSTHILGGSGGDTNLYFWLVTSFPHNLIERGWFETNSFYPYKDTLAWSDNFIFPCSIFYLLKKIFSIGEIASWNIIILFAQFLNGISAFTLARKLNGKYSSSLAIGSLFIASSYFAEHLGHPQLQFFFFITFGINIFLDLINKPNIHRAILFSGVIILTFLSTVYYAISLLLVCFLYFCLSILAQNIPTKKCLAKLIFSGFLSLIILIPFIIPYLGVKELFGARGLHEFYYFGLSALSFFSAAPISYYYGFSATLSQGEAHFAWGLTGVFLISLGVAQIFKRSPKTIIFALCALILAEQNFSILFELNRTIRLYTAAIFCWLTIIYLVLNFYKAKEKSIYLYLAGIALILLMIAVGPLGYPEIGVHALGPFTLFYKGFPGLDSLRAISRLGSIVILLLSLASIPTLNRFGKKVLVIIPLLIIDSRVTSFPLAPLASPPNIFASIPSLIKKEDVFLIAPLAGKLDKNNQIISWSEVAEINSSYLVALRDSSPVLINGYSGQRPKTIFELPRIMQRFPSQAALDKLLRFKGLKYIVILGTKIEGFSIDQFLSELEHLGENKIKVLRRDGLDFILELQR